MANFSSDQKLELLHHIRMENQNDRLRMRQREQILYGNGITGQIPVKSIMEDERVYVSPAYGRRNEEWMRGDSWTVRNEKRFGGGFRIRMMMAVLLFGIYLFQEHGYIKTGLSSRQLTEVLNKDFSPNPEEMFFDFENSFPYTIFR